MHSLSSIVEVTERTATSAISNTSNSSKMDTKMKEAVRACQLGTPEVVRDLLVGGHVSVDELDEEECAMLHWAAINGKLEVIRVLLTYHANIDIIGGYMKSTPLHWACYNSQLATVATLVMNGANPHLRNVNGETALHVAARTGNTMVIAYLMCKYESIRDWRDNLGRSALMIAAMSSFGMFPTRIFTTFDVFPDFIDDETGDTALHISLKRQNLRGAVELLCAGADETIKNKNNQTPFDLVTEQLENQVREEVTTRQVRESSTIWEKIPTRWFFIQLFTATITGVIMAAGIALFFLTNFWVLLAVMGVSFALLVYFGRTLRMDQLAYLPVTYICYVGMAELGMLIYDTSGYIHWTILMFMCTIWAVSATFYWVLVLTDPGVKPRSTNPFTEYVTNVEQHGVPNYCFTCWIPRYPSSHHCSQCDKCVDGFDHHCPWIHKCVYRKNLRFFVLFCATNFLFDVLYVPLLMYIIGSSFAMIGFEATLEEHGIMIVSLLLAIPHVFGAGVITYTQFSQISRRVTTIQTIKRCREKNSTEKSVTPSSEEMDIWNHKPSMASRIENVWNLLAYDQFMEDSSEECTVTSTAEPTGEASSTV